MIHLRLIEVVPAPDVDTACFPFSVPALRGLERLEIEQPVTLLVGENGSGKSTFLEALAWAAESVAAGSESLDLDSTLAHVRPLGESLKLSWARRTRRGFFLRAEDFFGYVKRTKATIAELESETERVMATYPDLPEAELARRTGPFRKEIHELQRRYGRDMDARSHGEQFLTFFQQRLVPDGLYLLDEPEAPLSPSRQLALLSILMRSAAEDRAQFVISTHSPILMACPEATILSFDDVPPRKLEYGELQHVTLMRDFLNRPEAFLRHL